MTPRDWVEVVVLAGTVLYVFAIVVAVPALLVAIVAWVTSWWSQ